MKRDGSTFGDAGSRILPGTRRSSAAGDCSPCRLEVWLKLAYLVGCDGLWTPKRDI